MAPKPALMPPAWRTLVIILSHLAPDETGGPPSSGTPLQAPSEIRRYGCDPTLKTLGENAFRCVALNIGGFLHHNTPKSIALMEFIQKFQIDSLFLSEMNMNLNQIPYDKHPHYRLQQWIGPSATITSHNQHCTDRP